MVGHSPIPRFDSTFCGETIVSKTAQESGYLVELSGTAVALAYNLGNGQGYSVQQVIEAVQHVVAEDGRTLKVNESSRRPGDPPQLVADATLARRELGWQPQYADLEIIIRHAWAWEKKLAGNALTQQENT
ncbi:GDP-mannose 4,6-dehydratase [Thioalkalivibrio sp. ALJT]|uniref:GDP-mannose 4,6-dehydratase n=1 Tax=Thioalkalivibrio sp. ALJT TaxID=1158146 RepID=UPI0018CA28F9|nr:GDP-mannose 4,6-dehydratase [Thioalkalivibrio sp. ALJT]